ncbi:MAG: branched-chain amino acid transferase [Mesorhizobium sp.]|uniref:aminotransferase class IV n=1 Tax=unclassified Mesorhizobium TaxID=325217 RepID=UPI000F74D587|nr:MULTISPECIES: aminotransferase class IV [unclassified Mesorhizobium]AZN98026.1 branched-chain amino acid transferase [Mesorhizobium sp. M9A.F.Ca.ET.002.03.1.2]AZN98039.1 branched-chain amino acid transferase [Mesorhizobium sp. M9A.F.Ca.ET.002.03.1.2]AZO19541.1 branched-chain amino acid transferase [Mesorhizobium sp. M1E.F.Ca.ET.045.02.1.1]AZO19555.1 branched-chain amino acid transferase [Mesorhizobium sp. M1E.F.Ca.ET.045.02.1.1]RWB25640.1 MAG: branched-chain amino acid transferase [Mesorhiz
MTLAMTQLLGALPTVDEHHVDRRQYPRGVAFMDGQYLPMSEAKVSVLDWGFLHSDATYDTVHVWKGRFFRLDLHLDRFFGGVERLRMKLPYDREKIASILNNCVALSGHQSAYVEMICTRGTSPTFSRDPRQAENRFMAFAVPFGSVANKEQLERGLHVAISETVRIPPKSVDPAIKNYHWLDLVKGLFDAYDMGAETALIVDTNGHIAEGPGFNVFVVKDGSLRTPAFGVLPGITRRTVFDLCAEIGLSATAADISRAEIKDADEVFITSTAGGIMPVTRIGDASVSNGHVGPVTRRLMDLYWQKHDDPQWTTAVTYP